jgi:SsrA-binding protein
MPRKQPRTDQPRVVNRKARHNYHIHQKIEAGIALTGSEVKSLRDGRAQLTDAYVRINDCGATLYDMQIDRYPPATDRNHEPKRKRRLLLHRREIRKLAAQLAQEGFTLIPVSLYFNARGLAKVELGLATGKKQHDRREDLKKRAHQREIDRAMSRRR